MAECRDLSALLYGLAANGADLVAGVAGFGAGCCLCVLNFGLVTQSRNFLALLQDLAAPLANLIAGVTSLSAGSLNNVCKLISCNVCNRLGDSNELFVYLRLKIGLKKFCQIRLDTGENPPQTYFS